MWKKEAKKNLLLFMKAGLPYTVVGVVIVFGGIYAIQKIFRESEYLTAYLFLWLAIFWIVYQPMFKKRIQKVAQELKKQGKI
jgi:cobalamin biosynthesis protein CobD/CbiB